MSNLQLGYAEVSGLQLGADQTREAQLGTGLNNHGDPNEIQGAMSRALEELQEIFQKASRPEPDYVPPQEGLQVYLDHQAYMPDPVMLRGTPAAKLFFETFLANYSRR
jgi:hypothetical protein